MSPRRTIAFVFALAFARGVAAQIPVVDAANLGQQVQQVASWVQQLKAMADQVEQARQQYASLTGNRGYGQLLNDPRLRQYLTGNETPSSQALRQRYGGNTCSYLSSQEAIQYCNNAASQPYQDYDQIANAIAVANQKPQQIQALIDQINSTDDPKAIAELQARIAGEQASMQNESMKLQLTLQQMQIQNQLIKEQQSRAVSERERALENKARAIIIR